MSLPVGRTTRRLSLRPSTLRGRLAMLSGRAWMLFKDQAWAVVGADAPHLAVAPPRPGEP